MFMTKRYCRLVIVALIATVFMAADFFHTETTFEEQDLCPICLWQMTSLGIDQVASISIAIVFIVIRLVLRTEEDRRTQDIRRHYDSRAPPSLSPLQ